MHLRAGAAGRPPVISTRFPPGSRRTCGAPKRVVTRLVHLDAQLRLAGRIVRPEIAEEVIQLATRAGRSARHLPLAVRAKQVVVDERDRRGVDGVVTRQPDHHVRLRLSREQARLHLGRLGRTLGDGAAARVGEHERVFVVGMLEEIVEARVFQHPAHERKIALVVLHDVGQRWRRRRHLPLHVRDARRLAHLLDNIQRRHVLERPAVAREGHEPECRHDLHAILRELVALIASDQ